MQLKLFKKILSTILTVLILFPARLQANIAEYKVGPGDALSVSIAVQGSPNDLNKISALVPMQIIGDKVFYSLNLTVAPDGTIVIPSGSAPLMVSGLTLMQIQNKISLQLKSPLSANTVSVSLTKAENSAYFIWGEVARPGRYVIERPTTLMEGIATAGGATQRAKLNHVLILSATGSKSSFDLRDRILKEGTVPTVQLNPSDIVVIPKRKLSDLGIWFLVLSLIGTAATVSIATR